MLIIGLTGSMGMGKSSASSYLRSKGVSIFDADAEVHKIYTGEIAREVEKFFPGSTTALGVDRNILSQKLTQDPSGFRKLQEILSPLLDKRMRSFLNDCMSRGEKLAVLDVPLLFETDLNKRVDVVILMSASEDTQRQRVLLRPGMTEEKLAHLLSRQLPDLEKRRRAHFVVDTNGSLQSTQHQLDVILQVISDRPGEAYARDWN